jgi:hypothetical protein
VTLQDVSGLTLTLEDELHIARHYQSLPSEYRTRLLDKGVDPYALEGAAETVGSKFIALPELETPTLLLEYLKPFLASEVEKSSFVWQERAQGVVAYFSVDLDRPIGYEGVVSIGSLPADDRQKIQQELRDQFTVKVIHSYSASQTNIISGILVRDSHTIRLATAYPGKTTPDFPEEASSKEEQDYNKAFWQNYAFIA